MSDVVSEENLAPAVFRMSWRSILGEGFFMSSISLILAFYVSGYLKSRQEDVLSDEKIAAAADPEKLASLQQTDLTGVVWLVLGGVLLFWFAQATMRVLKSRIVIDKDSLTILHGGLSSLDTKVGYDEIESLLIRRVGIDKFLGIGAIGVQIKDEDPLDMVIAAGYVSPEKIAESIESRRLG